jgi:CheY-like chemotaxis protein
MRKPTILVVEDDAAIRELVAFHLQRSGIEVIEAADADAAWRALDGATRSCSTGCSPTPPASTGCGASAAAAGGRCRC